MNRISPETTGAFAWAAATYQHSEHALDPAARRAVAKARPSAPTARGSTVIDRLPADRAAARSLRAGLPPRWRLALDRARAGVLLAPPVLTALEQLVSAHVGHDSRPQLLGRDVAEYDLDALTEQLGLIGFVLGSRAASRRQRARILRKLGAPRQQRVRTIDESQVPDSLVTLCTDLFLGTSADDGGIEARLDSVGARLLAACVVDDDEAAASAIRDRLSGRARNRWLEHLAAARTSSRRDEFSEIRDALRELTS